MHERLSLIATVAVACSSPQSASDVDAPLPTPDVLIGNPNDADCSDAFAHIVADGLVPFGPTYGAYPPKARPPLAFLGPYECIAVRVETLAPDGLHLRLDFDGTSGWTGNITIDGGAPSTITPMLVAPNVAEATVDIANHPQYITLVAIPAGRPTCTRNLSLERFVDGSVAVVGYGGVDCDGGPR